MIIITRLLGVLTRGDHHFCAALHDQSDKVLSALAAIRDHVLELESVDQGRCLGAVMALPSAQAQAQRIAQSPSTVMWILVLNPPRLRPNACSA